WIAARARADGQVALVSENFNNRSAFSLASIQQATGAEAWSNYVRGAAHALQAQGHRLCGMDALVWGDVPVGSGLSSSAALLVASTLAFSALAELDLSPLDIALRAQQAEVEFVGVNVGVMDQMISALGQAGHALLIDCHSLAHRPVPVPNGVAVVIADSMKRRGLVDSKYNERRAECEEGARRLGVQSLRDVTIAALEAKRASLPELIWRRCRHVVGENARVLACVEALRAGRLDEVGALLVQSHESLRDDYEVSCRELDVMVEAALRQEGIIGARMTGAGFGGCTVNLVREERAGRFVDGLREAYRAQTGLTPSIYVCRATDGAQAINLSLSGQPT
ncbi:MAG: galactokinase, partial [Chloroflexi bacterium]|nr:galactokinase [Chloroflexota bacterium]